MYIPSHQELGNHPKLRRLARTLAISRPAAVGHLHYLWWWSQNYAPDGDLSFERYTAEDIADAAMWDGDAYTFVDALKTSGFLDDEDGRLILHDWQEYGGKVVKDMAKDRERKRGKGNPPTSDEPPQSSESVPNTSTGVPPEFHRNSGVDKIREEERREEKRETRERAPAAPPTPAVEAVASIAEVTDDQPHAMVAMLCDENGKVIDAMAPTWVSQQRGIAKFLIEQGHGIEQVRAYVRYRKTAWNGHEPFDLRKVKNDIDEWELADSPATAPARASPNGKPPPSRANTIDRPLTTTITGKGVKGVDDDDFKRVDAEAHRRAAARQAATGG